ncbi:MAG: hypothetical protein K5839_05715 [Treponemataceae bacterium]|nr:hypothetical protein [Treponemataceae bacterium]
MLLTYALWFFGIIFGILTAVEIAVIIYRLYNKNKNVKTNIIIAVITAILCIGFSSFAVFTMIDKVVNSDTSLNEISKKFGKASADVTANAYQGFIETWDETVNEKENK